MRYRVDTMEGYLRVEVDGRYEAAVSAAAIADVFAACAAKGINLVLVDARALDPSFGIADRFELARALAERRPGAVRIAILAVPAQMTTKTLEDAASNRGMLVRTTVDAGEAYGFLGLAPPA